MILVSTGRVLQLLLTLLLLLPASCEPLKKRLNSFKSEYEHEFCLLSAVSSNHFQEFLASFLQYALLTYPDKNIFVYSLGLKQKESQFLQSLDQVTLLPLKLAQGQNYVNKYNAKVFKAPSIFEFMKSKRCNYFFYGDASVRVVKKFDERMFSRLKSRGIVTEMHKHHKNHMYTHPAMFPFFGVDRNDTIRKQLTHTQSGLMLIDSGNALLHESFFPEWVKCSYLPECISPDNITTGYCSGNDRVYFGNGGEKMIYRCHRDDQSAFTLLLAKYFGYADISSRKSDFIDDYTNVLRINRRTYGKMLSEMKVHVPTASSLDLPILMKVVSSISINNTSVRNSYTQSI